MRDFKGMKRQRGRNRNGGGGGKPQHNANRAFDSNGPDNVKVRGAAQHVYEKYQQLARDAHTAGDRVVAENYLQHAEHYFRVMRAMQPLRPLSEIIGRDQFVSGYDIDFEDESGLAAAAAAEPDPEGGDRSDRPRDDYRQGEFRQGDQRGRDERPQGDRFQGDRGQNDRFQSDRSQGERPSGDRNQNDRSQRGFRDERPRFNRDDHSNRFERPEQSDREPAAAVEPEPTSPLASPLPAGNAPVLRADDGEVNHAPAFLQVRPVEAREDGEARHPRRRRAPRGPEIGGAAPAVAEAADGDG